MEIEFPTTYSISKFNTFKQGFFVEIERSFYIFCKSKISTKNIDIAVFVEII
jgi:hypothetical protein